MNGFLRLLLSVGAVGCFYLTNAYLITMAPVMTGQAAVLQLNNSNDSYLASQIGMHGYPVNGLSLGLLIIVLLLIWFKPMKRILGFAPMMVFLLALSSPAYAFYERTDMPEFWEIAPNQSAFLIPLVGANKDSQGQFGSSAYLDANKVALKRVQIPHTLIRNPGWSADYYVPAAKLVIVDRSPYQRVWTGKGTGTNANVDESSHGDTSDGVNFSFNIAVAAWVREEDTANFLYNFGTKNAVANPNDPASNFSSVAYGRSLAEVMDTVVMAAVHTKSGEYFGVLKLSEIEAKKIIAIKAVEKDVKEFFAKKGITVDFVGMASGINFDNPAIQKAMDDLVIADMDALKAGKLAPTLPYLQANANIQMQQNVSAALQKWNGALPALPSVVTVPSDAVAGLIGAFKGISGSLVQSK